VECDDEEGDPVLVWPTPSTMWLVNRCVAGPQVMRIVIRGGRVGRSPRGGVDFESQRSTLPSDLTTAVHETLDNEAAIEHTDSSRTFFLRKTNSPPLPSDTDPSNRQHVPKAARPRYEHRVPGKSRHPPISPAVQIMLRSIGAAADMSIDQFNAKQARREAQKAAKQDNELKKQIQGVRGAPRSLPAPRA